jgi:hypothetical protein
VAKIDFDRRMVTRYQTKKSKFEAIMPYVVSCHVSLKNNKFILQIKVTNSSYNKVFPESFTFHPLNEKEYKVTDLNQNAFRKSHVFDRDEVRSLIFIIQHTDPNHKINKFRAEQLGKLEIRWFNYLGDPGVLTVSPIKYKHDHQSKFPVEIQQT